MARLKDGDRDQHAFIIQMGNQTFVEFSTAETCYVYGKADFPFDLSGSGYYIHELVDRSRAKSINWRERLDALIASEAGIDLLPKSQLGRW